MTNGQRSTWACLRCLTVLGLALLFAGCTQTGADATRDPFQAYGLIRSHSQQALIERAVVISNITLSDDVPFRFQLTWNESGLHPRFVFLSSARRDYPRLSVEHVGDEYRYRNAVAIPVYLIDDDRLGAHENVFVPDGCRCVLVNCRSVAPMLDAFGIGEKTALLRYSEYERASVYGTALLHEMGHLLDGDSGSYTEPVSITSADVTTGFDHSTNKEIHADRFAVQQLRQALDADDWHASPTGYPGEAI